MSTYKSAPVSYLPQGGKSGAESCVCAGAVLDPGGKFGERSRSRVTTITQHHGGIVATVTNSSSFGQKRSNTCSMNIDWTVSPAGLDESFIYVFMNTASPPMD